LIIVFISLNSFYFIFMLGYSIYKFWKTQDLEKMKIKEIMKLDEERKTFFELSYITSSINLNSNKKDLI
jgi:hypothetical protein